MLSLLSPSFLPISLLDQSSFLSLELDIRPGTTRGIVVRFVLVGGSFRFCVGL